MSSKLAHMSSKLTHMNPILASIRPKHVCKSCNSVRMSPKLAHVSPRFAKCLLLIPILTHLRSNLVRKGPKLAHVRPKLAYLWVKLAHVWSKLAYVWAKLAHVLDLMFSHSFLYWNCSCRDFRCSWTQEASGQPYDPLEVNFLVAVF